MVKHPGWLRVSCTGLSGRHLSSVWSLRYWLLPKLISLFCALCPGFDICRQPVYSSVTGIIALSTALHSATDLLAAARELLQVTQMLTTVSHPPDGQAQRQAVPSIMTTHLTTAILVWR